MNILFITPSIHWRSHEARIAAMRHAALQEHRNNTHAIMRHQRDDISHDAIAIYRASMRLWIYGNEPEIMLQHGGAT